MGHPMRSFKQGIYGCTLLLLTSSPFAFGGTVEVEASGSGLSREQAIENALTEAIRQVRGVNIDQQMVRQAMKVKVNDEAVLSSEITNKTASRTQGYVERYQILDEDCTEQYCNVVISASIPVYKSPGIAPDNRRKLVVSKFSGSSGAEFSQYLQTHLVQSRRFAVLDREHNVAFSNERNLLLSADTPQAEKIRLGQVLGMDYLIVGSVAVESGQSTNNISLTGELQSLEYGQARVSYQVINIATRQIKWQDDALIDLEMANPEQIAAEAAEEVARTIIDAIYPIKVLSQSGNQLVLNQGGKNVVEGYLYDVYGLGKKLVDPYTKESLGREEILLGQVRIDRVSTKLSYASVTSGDIRAMAKDTVLRKAKVVPDASGHMRHPVQSTVTPAVSGGILLPVAAPVPSPEGGVTIPAHSSAESEQRD